MYNMKVENDYKGLRTFISSEYRSLVNYVRRYLNDKYYDVNAEDIVQDVALNLFSKLDLDDQLENIAGYVYRSIRNKITDFQRKKKKEVPFQKLVNHEGEEFFLESIEETEEEELNEINDKNFYPVINEALKKLSPNQQMVFVATEFEGYTFEELADELDIPIGTLLSWKHRGVKKLKQIIRPEDLFTDNEN